MATLKEALDQLAKGHELDNEQKKLIIDKWQKELGIQPCENAISREDALMCMTGEYLVDKEYKPEDIISKHIRRLKALPPVQPKQAECKDAISRQAALDIYDDYNVAAENRELEAYSKYRKRLLKLPSVQPKYNTDEWCHNCKEYDQDKHCCPRYNKVIRNAVEEIKQPKTHWISYWDEEARCYVYKCPECGNKQPFDTKHCWECGTKLSEISTGSESEE